MALKPRPFPAALPHGELREVLPGLFFVTGTIAMSMGVSMRFSRNMTVIREGERLILVNTVRLDEAGLAALDALGKVTDVIRIAGNHGMDDPFYKDRYGAKVWVVAGQRYVPGFDTKATDVYFEPDVEMTPDTPLPVEGARLHVIASRPPEGLLVLERHGGVAISGDALQHWVGPDAYFNFLGRTIMRMMGFFVPYNVGPAWRKQCRPPKEDMRGILGLSLSHVFPSHGEPVIGGALESYRPAIEAAS